MHLRSQSIERYDYLKQGDTGYYAPHAGIALWLLCRALTSLSASKQAVLNGEYEEYTSA